MSVINTNYLSLVAQNNLTKSQSALGTAIERLSSGLRINSAKDDAAGQAIANRMTSQVNGLNQAARNANDGISVAQTTEGALNQINDNLQRIRVLTVQSANATNSPDDLTSIQNEIGQRLGEINRISEETSFNGVKVLAGDEQLKIQVGTNDNEVISVGLKKINSNTLGLEGFNVNGAGSVANKAATKTDLDTIAAATGGNVEKTGTGASATYKMTTANTAVTAEEVLSGIAETIGVTVGGTTTTAQLATALADSVKEGWTTAGATVALNGLKSDGNGGFKFNVAGFTDAEAAAAITPPTAVPASASTVNRATYTNGGASHDILIKHDGSITDTDGVALNITADGELTYDTSVAGTTAATAGKLATAMDALGAGKEATLTFENGMTLKSDAGTLTLEDVSISAEDLADVIDAESLTVTTTTTAGRDGEAGVDAIEITGDGSGTLAVEANGKAVYKNADGALTQAAKEKVELFVRDNGNITDIAANQYFVGEDGKLTASATTTSARTENPLKALDDALNMVDSLRSDLGAIQNRFESAITNLKTSVTNLSSARSRIEDADYAVEVANMSKNQILQQAGTSVLAQANQIPQGVLSLLR